jgi:ABC-type branched-subunit amino acid transport system substrate-binding protein
MRSVAAMLLTGVLVLTTPGVNAQENAFDPGVTDTVIKLGQSGAFSGPASALGSFSRIYAAYFKAVNDKGGINGRKIELIQLDNVYSPSKALEASRRLVEGDGVFAEVATLGTIPNAATQQYLNKKEVPQLFVAAGGSKFNDPQRYPWTVPFYPPISIEAAAYARYVLKAFSNGKLAILYQNDDYGKDYLNGFKKALGDQNQKMIVAIASYELGDPTVNSQVVSLAASGASVFLNFSTPKYTAQAARKVKELKWNVVQVVTSTAAASRMVLEQIGLENCEGTCGSDL